MLILWASPNSAVGLFVGAIAWFGGARFVRRQGCIEIHGGLVTWILKKMLPPGGAAALTIGHVIWGQSAESLDVCRAHEHVHVRQYERWGPLFLPAYLACSAWLWWRGKDAYRDNPFEIAAYNHSDPARRCDDDPGLG